MRREHLKELLEGIGFIAIIASLVFVGIETRNSTRQAELNTQSSDTATWLFFSINAARSMKSVCEVRQRF